ncbi:hypothetical protein DZC52_01080, partial [Wenzhouxiangella sediminis]
MALGHRLGSEQVGSHGTDLSLDRDRKIRSLTQEARGCIWVSGFRFQVSGFRFPGSGFRVPGSGFRVPGSGFR